MGRVRPLHPERPGVALSRHRCRPLKATARPRAGGGGPPPAPDGRVVPVHRSSGTEWVKVTPRPPRRPEQRIPSASASFVFFGHIPWGALQKGTMSSETGTRAFPLFPAALLSVATGHPPWAN